MFKELQYQESFYSKILRAKGQNQQSCVAIDILI